MMSKQQEFSHLFSASEPEIRRYIAGVTPHQRDLNEILQQTATVLWEKFDDYDRSREFTPWACRFAFHQARSWMQKQHRWQSFRDKNIADLLLARREQIQPEVDNRMNQLATCIEKLNENQKALLDGYYNQEMTIERVAENSQKTVSATYKSLQRIRERLRLCIESVQEKLAGGDK